MNLAEFIQAFRAEGILDSEGSFTVSLSQARAKLRDFRSSDDSRFLLHVVAACHGAGAQRIAIERSPARVTLNAPGARFSEADLIEAYTHFFRLQHQTPASELVMGAVMVQALEAEGLMLSCRQPEGPSFCWRLDEDEETSEQAPSGETRVEFEARFGSALGAWLVGWLGGETSWRDCQWLEQLCSLSRVPISVNGRRLNRPFPLTYSPVWLCRGADLPLQTGGAQLLQEAEGDYAAALAPGSGPLYLIVRGVRYPGPQVNLMGLVYCDRLRLDLSLEQVVQDSRYSELVEDLKRRFDDLLCACDLEQAGQEWSRPYLPRLVQLAGQDRMDVLKQALLADWLDQEAPAESERAREELTVLRKVLDFHESQGNAAGYREIAEKAYTRARRLISQLRKSLELVDLCARLAGELDHPSVSSWRLLGAALALERCRDGAAERLREQQPARIPQPARPFLQLGLWALEKAAGDSRAAGRTRSELLRSVESFSDELARREIIELFQESPQLVCAYAGNKLRHFASYDPEVRAALMGGSGGKPPSRD